MKNGDISNYYSPRIAFRLDNFLFSTEEAVKINRLSDIPTFLKSIIRPDPKILFNGEAIYMMGRIALRTEYSTPLIVHSDFLTENIQDMIDEYIPFHSTIYVITKQSDVHDLLSKGEITYYIDGNIDRINSTNSDYAMSVQNLDRVLNIRSVRR